MKTEIEKLKEANRILVSTMGLELRGPISAMAGLASILLKEPDMSQTEKEEICNLIIQYSGKMHEFINQVLEKNREILNS